MKQFEIRPRSGVGVHTSTQLPIDLFDCGGVESLIERRTILALPAVLNDLLHTVLIQRAFEGNDLGSFDESNQCFLKTIRTEMGCSYKK
jgi:hypothetical protein